MPLFKTPDDLLQEGNDRLLRGDFPGAQRSFQSASDGFSKKGIGPGAQYARALSVVMGLSSPNPSAGDYQAVVEALLPLGELPIKLGPRTIAASQLRHEADLLREERSILASAPSTPEAHQAAGARLQALSVAYRQMGNQVLHLPELFQRGTVAASSKAPALAALAEEELGEASVVQDPKRAAEHNQNARNWWLQVGEAARAQAATERVQRYGRAVKCWFCGREVAGEGINFRQLPSDVTGFPASQEAGALAECDPQGGVVYACRPCGSAVERLADEKAQLRAKEIELRVNKMLESMRSKAGPMGQQWIPSTLPP